MTDFLTADTNLPSYMMFPRFLLDMEINETAKMLYIILLDRARLSQKNEGWSDTDGHVFIYFTIEALAEVLHKSQMTVKTALAVLEKQELIFRKRQGPGQPNRIYVKLPKETIHYTDRFLSLRQTENCPIDRQDSFPDTDRKLSGNKKEIKKNNLAIRGSKEPLSPYGKFQNVFLSEKELEDIRQTIPDCPASDFSASLDSFPTSARILFLFCCLLLCPKSSLCFSVRISSGASLDFCTEGRIFFPLRSDWRGDLSTRFSSFSPCFPPICTSLARLLTRTEDLSVRFSSTRPSLVIFWTFIWIDILWRCCIWHRYSLFITGRERVSEEGGVISGRTENESQG